MEAARWPARWAASLTHGGLAMGVASRRRGAALSRTLAFGLEGVPAVLSRRRVKHGQQAIARASQRPHVKTAGRAMAHECSATTPALQASPQLAAHLDTRHRRGCLLRHGLEKRLHGVQSAEHDRTQDPRDERETGIGLACGEAAPRQVCSKLKVTPLCRRRSRRSIRPIGAGSPQGSEKPNETPATRHRRRCSPLADEEKMIRFGRGSKKDEAQAEAAGRHSRAPRLPLHRAGRHAGQRQVGGRASAGRPASISASSTPTRRSSAPPASPSWTSSRTTAKPYFRDGERKVIARLLGAGPQVLATGGGALMEAETRDNIRRSGISIWLKAELPVLMRRVLKRNNRPLLENDPERVMRQLMEARDPIYATADITVESRDLPHDTIVGEIIDGAGRQPRPGECSRRSAAAPAAAGRSIMSAERTSSAAARKRPRLRDDPRGARQPVLRRADRARPDASARAS